MGLLFITANLDTKVMLGQKCNEFHMVLQLQVKPLLLSFFKMHTFQLFMALLVTHTPGRDVTGAGKELQDSSELYCEGWATAPAPIMPGIHWCHFIFHSTQDISHSTPPSSFISCFCDTEHLHFLFCLVTVFTVHREQSHLSLSITTIQATCWLHS